ncbi:MAG TPA: sulfite exporter TauE/SafE family protein [Vicinamibacterales bacterium]|nr:sulfite exporter TauE/SafE family protein [Vicinamibacterales bacterium]
MIFLAAVFVVAVMSGATASLVGFGIGSMLTPLLALQVGTDIAVAAVSLPHALATAMRCWRLRASIDWSVLKRFGVLSALGGLAGALAYTTLDANQLTRVLGALLVVTATAQLSGLAARWHPRGVSVALLGVGSGFFGGIAGNQGGLRAAALTAFGLAPIPFVATSTATGLLVDAARTPVYLFTAGGALAALWLPISTATAGVVIGTLLGERILFGMSRERFRIVVAASVGLLGLWLLAG